MKPGKVKPMEQAARSLGAVPQVAMMPWNVAVRLASLELATKLIAPFTTADQVIQNAAEFERFALGEAPKDR